jgi:hypothetical protein
MDEGILPSRLREDAVRRSRALAEVLVGLVHHQRDAARRASSKKPAITSGG